MLYNEERPVRFDDLKGQHANIRVFKSQIEKREFSQAYLFAGHHGSGKTTTARILAKAAICENPLADGPCCECDACKSFENSVDVIEIDAASNTGVDAIRDKVIEAVRYRPVEMSKKEIIIDEVHMLSNSAFNALLKTIEEPPEDVILFLCTTELHKVPATIISRCQKFIFQAIPYDEIKANVLAVSNKHGIDIDDKAAGIIAKAANGSMRDALSILEQAASEDITVSGISEMVGFVDTEIIDELLLNIKKGNYKDAVDAVDKFLSYSNVAYLIDALLERIIDKACEGDTSYMELVDKISLIRGKNANATALKACFYTLTVKNVERNSLIERIEKLEKEVEALKKTDFNNAKSVESISAPQRIVEEERIPNDDLGFSSEGMNENPFGIKGPAYVPNIGGSQNNVGFDIPDVIINEPVLEKEESTVGQDEPQSIESSPWDW